MGLYGHYPESNGDLQRTFGRIQPSSAKGVNDRSHAPDDGKRLPSEIHADATETFTLFLFYVIEL